MKNDDACEVQRAVAAAVGNAIASFEPGDLERLAQTIANDAKALRGSPLLPSWAIIAAMFVVDDRLNEAIRDVMQAHVRKEAN